MALAENLIGHYDKTYDVTLEMWGQRNRLFIYLLIIVGVAVFLTLGSETTNALLVDFLAKLLSIENVQRIRELRSGFPYNLLQTILLIVVFYLMVSLYHRSRFVIRSYIYLELMEKEIRKQLELADSDIAFTREGSFYWTVRDPFANLVKWGYFVLLGGLLVLFLFNRLKGDILDKNWLFTSIDSITALFILIFFAAYSFNSIKLEKKSEHIALDVQSDQGI